MIEKVKGILINGRCNNTSKLSNRPSQVKHLLG